MSDAQELEEELRNGSEEKLPEEPSANDGTGDDSALSDDFENLAIEIGKLKDTLARSQADYKNLVARTERERLEMADFVTERLITRLLPSVDNLERLLSGTSESERSGALYEGVKSTFSGIVRTLESLGVSTFDSVGETLDPAFHEAVAQVPGEAGKIANEFEKGYKLQGKVIRHAKVTVGNGEEA